jgi:hypothetical protein
MAEFGERRHLHRLVTKSSEHEAQRVAQAQVDRLRLREQGEDGRRDGPRPR